MYLGNVHVAFEISFPQMANGKRSGKMGANYSNISLKFKAL